MRGGGGEKGGAPRVPQGQRAADVLGLIDAFDGHPLRRALLDHLGKPAEDAQEANLKRTFGGRPDHAEVDHAVFSLRSEIDDTKAGGDEAGVDAEDDQRVVLGFVRAGGVEVRPDIADIVAVFHGLDEFHHLSRLALVESDRVLGILPDLRVIRLDSRGLHCA